MTSGAADPVLHPRGSYQGREATGAARFVTPDGWQSGRPRLHGRTKAPRWWITVVVHRRCSQLLRRAPLRTACAGRAARRQASLRARRIPALLIAAGARDVPELEPGAFADAEEHFAGAIPGAVFHRPEGALITSWPNNLRPSARLSRWLAGPRITSNVWTCGASAGAGPFSTLIDPAAGSEQQISIRQYATLAWSQVQIPKDSRLVKRLAPVPRLPVRLPTSAGVDAAESCSCETRDGRYIGGSGVRRTGAMSRPAIHTVKLQRPTLGARRIGWFAPSEALAWRRRTCRTGGEDKTRCCMRRCGGSSIRHAIRWPRIGRDWECDVGRSSV